MRGQPGFFDIDDRLKRPSDLGDQLETFRSAMDFEVFRLELNSALSYRTARIAGGHPSTRC
jgi:IS5 family transposase